MVEYKLHEQTILSTDGDSYTSYGLIALDGKTQLQAVPDISSDRNAVENLIDKFNKYGLELCHLSIAIEDFLYDQSSD